MLGVFSANISFHNWFQGQVAGTPQMRKVKESVTPVLPSRSFAWPYTEVSSAAAGAVVCESWGSQLADVRVRQLSQAQESDTHNS